MPFNNKLYTDGFLGFVDWLWLLLTRIRMILGIIALICIIVVFLVGGKNLVYKLTQQTETFVANSDFKNINRLRENMFKII